MTTTRSRTCSEGVRFKDEIWHGEPVASACHRFPVPQRDGGAALTRYGTPRYIQVELLSDCVYDQRIDLDVAAVMVKVFQGGGA